MSRILIEIHTRYKNEVSVDKCVYKNVELFKENKKEDDDLFDCLNTLVSIMVETLFTKPHVHQFVGLEQVS